MEKAPYPYAGLPLLSPDPEPLIHISGPMNSGGVMVENIRRALDVAVAIRYAGGLPFVPQLHFLWEVMSPKRSEFFLAMDREYVRRSSALLEENGGLGRLRDALRLGAFR